MTHRKWGRLSATQKVDLWSRWKAGKSFHEIGRALGKDHVVIHFLLARRGGMTPAARRRSLRTLTLAEREDISRGIAGGSSLRDIAKHLQRAVSTVSREVARHGGRPQYRANDADQQAWNSALRPKICLLGRGRARFDSTVYPELVCVNRRSGPSAASSHRERFRAEPVEGLIEAGQCRVKAQTG
jgi:IS30 family transposase